MVIKIYSDASSKDTYGVAISLIMTDNTFITHLVRDYSEVEQSEFEVLGVLQGLEYVVSEGLPFSKLICYTDSTQAIKAFKNKDGSKLQADSYKRLRKVCTDIGYVNITMKHIFAHQGNHNPNKVCDMLANVYRLGLVPGEVKHLKCPKTRTPREEVSRCIKEV